MLRPFSRLLIIALATVLLVMPVHGEDHQSNIDEVLLILSDSSLQTQGMAMVLGNAMADKGATVNVLLCDSAGDLALSAYQSDTLKPRDLTPGQMLGRLIQQGASIKVCALYLPNNEHTEADLRDGVGVAMPPEMAAQMLNPDMRIFTF